jgi:hypothetical protein
MVIIHAHTVLLASCKPNTTQTPCLSSSTSPGLINLFTCLNTMLPQASVHSSHLHHPLITKNINHTPVTLLRVRTVNPCTLTLTRSCEIDKTCTIDPRRVIPPPFHHTLTIWAGLVLRRSHLQDLISIGRSLTDTHTTSSLILCRTQPARRLYLRLNNISAVSTLARRATSILAYSAPQYRCQAEKRWNNVARTTSCSVDPSTDTRLG